MDTNSLLIFLLFLSALVIGFLLARYPINFRSIMKRSSSQAHLDRYRESVNFLITEQPDAAIDALTATLDVNEETLETHMALGAMLRKRGEVDRAIRVHQNVLSRPNLTAGQALQAQLALAEDYLKAGLFDRAEALYTELSHADESGIAQKALVRLVEVYQQEGEWQQAIVAADALCQSDRVQDAMAWRQLQAQFYCELADQALHRRYYSEAKEALLKAGSLDADLARVQILRGQLALDQNDNTKALSLLRQVPLDFSAHNSEVYPLLIEAFNRTHEPAKLHGFLADIYHQQPSALLLPAMARAVAVEKSEPKAVEFLVGALEQWKHLEPLNEVLKLLPASTYQQLALESILGVIEQRITQVQSYECQGCGYSGYKHHWQCPSCKRWGTVISKF